MAYAGAREADLRWMRSRVSRPQPKTGRTVDVTLGQALEATPTDGRALLAEAMLAS